MDYDGHIRAAMHSSLCNVVNYEEGPVGSMMALMTTDHQQVEQAREAQHHHHHPHQHHQPHQALSHSEELHINIPSNTVSSASTQAPSSSFAYYNAALEPYLQSAFLQAAHAFHHQAEAANLHQTATLEHNIEPSVVIPSTAEDEKPNLSSKLTPASGHLMSGSRECDYMISTNGPAPLHVSPSGTSVTTQEARASVAMETNNTQASRDESGDPVRAKIIAHPSYPQLVMAYVNCNKIGAPADIVTRLEEVSKKYQSVRASSPSAAGTDPELDQFMENYCNVLQKYHDELMQPYKEAMAFFRKIELQLNALSKGSLRLSQSGDGDNKGEGSNNMNVNGGGSSVDEEGEEEGDPSCGEVDYHEEMIDPLAEDQKLKEQLLRKYSGYICTLKQEFMKKKKKGKLPKDARQKLLDWWSQHYKWPYPSEAEKAQLAEVTGLDQKQINNWFINQRKRHWKPSEDMQYVMVDSPTHAVHHHHHQHPAYSTHALGHQLAAHPLSSYAMMETTDAAAAAAAAAAAVSILPSHHLQ